MPIDRSCWILLAREHPFRVPRLSRAGLGGWRKGFGPEGHHSCMPPYCLVLPLLLKIPFGLAQFFTSGRHYFFLHPFIDGVVAGNRECLVRHLRFRTLQHTCINLWPKACRNNRVPVNRLPVQDAVIQIAIAAQFNFCMSLFVSNWNFSDSGSVSVSDLANG